jgi:dihydroxyacetone kinase-like predicted kinase
MREQHDAFESKEEAAAEVYEKPAEQRDFAVIAIAAGDGLAEIFKQMGVDYVISGGQTMNPSTEDIVKAIDMVHAKQVIVLPNNKNIFMAANAAADVADTPTKVVETRTIPQGFTAMLSYDPTRSLEDNHTAMTAALSEVVSGSVTTAVRDTTIDGLEIHEDDVLGQVDGKIVVSNPAMREALMATFKEMIDEDSEIAIIYVGEDGLDTVAENVKDKLEELYEDLEVEIHQGGQPVYPYIFSVE